MSKRRGDRPFFKRAVFWVGVSIPALLVLYGALLYFTLPQGEGTEVGLARFSDLTDAGRIESAHLLARDNRVLFVADGRSHWVALPNSMAFVDNWVGKAVSTRIPLEVDQQALKGLLVPGTYIVPALLIVASFILFFLLSRSGASSPFLRAAARRGASGAPVTFADVAGNDEAVAEVREIRDYLAAPAQFTTMGAEPPRGILLVGPPGTGKTLLARAVAGEAGVPFFSMSGTDFVEMYVGVGAARVRDLFRQVRERAPAILFIDEIDAVGRTRSGGANAGQDERDQTLNQLLVELDGFHRDSGVVLIGATNRPDVLDPALLRRGRFDRQIVVDRPDRNGRVAILAVHAKAKRLAAEVDLDALAANTAGFTGADLASVMNEAALLAARRHRDAIGNEELEEAVERILSGNERRARLLSPEEKRAVACHESGHAIVAMASPSAPGLSKVSIVGRGSAFGYSRAVPEEERFVVGKEDLEQQLSVTLAGRAAEELLLGQPMSAAGDDLLAATALARRMVCELGMSDSFARRSLGQPSGGGFLGGARLEIDYSGEVAGEIDREIQRLLDRAFLRAETLLSDNRDVLEDLTSALIERETLRQSELADYASRITTGGGRDGGSALRLKRSAR